MRVCEIFRPPVQGGSNDLISKFLSSMVLYNDPSYFKSGEIDSCRLSPLNSSRYDWKIRHNGVLSRITPLPSSRYDWKIRHNGVLSGNKPVTNANTATVTRERSRNSFGATQRTSRYFPNNYLNLHLTRRVVAIPLGSFPPHLNALLYPRMTSGNIVFLFCFVLFVCLFFCVLSTHCSKNKQTNKQTTQPTNKQTINIIHHPPGGRIIVQKWGYGRWMVHPTLY